MIKKQELLEDYILDHIDEEPALLKQLDRDAHVNLLHAKMISGHLQGRLLKMFCRMLNPRCVLELGTYTGYATICMAEGMAEDAEIHTIEIHDELETFINKYITHQSVKDKIHLHIGDAFQIIPSLDKTFDIVYIDANKRSYIEYYNAIFDKVRPGGLIIADNTLWYGKIIEENKSSDKQTIGIKAFNEKIKHDNRVEKVILPIRDGLTLIWKKSSSKISATF